MKKKSNGEKGKGPGPERSRGSEINAQKDKAKGGILGQKKVVFIVEREKDAGLKCLWLKRILEEPRINPDISGAGLLDNFLSDPGKVKADVLIVESSMRFFSSVISDPALLGPFGANPSKGKVSEELERLKGALRAFRDNNPDAYVLVCACGYSDALEDLKGPRDGRSVIDELETDLSRRDSDLLDSALGGLEKAVQD